ncbi:MAG: hypothetical protein WD423_12320 [Rhodothermales bacterium]
MAIRSDTASPSDRSLHRRRNAAWAEFWLLLACYSVLYVAIAVLVERHVVTSDVISRSWPVDGLEDRFDAFAAQRRTWTIVGYAITPAFLVTKVGFTAVCLAAGCAIAYWDVALADLFRLSAQCEVIWVVAAVIQLIWAVTFIRVETVADYTGFYPLSALNLFDLMEDELWASYLLRSLNLFEVLYVGALALGLRAMIPRPIAHVVGLVAAAYGTGLFLFVAAVTFLLMALM